MLELEWHAERSRLRLVEVSCRSLVERDTRTPLNQLETLCRVTCHAPNCQLVVGGGVDKLTSPPPCRISHALQRRRLLAPEMPLL